MHTEHLQNVRPSWVVAGWLVAAAATSLISIVLAGLDLAGADAETGALWSVVAVALGFWIGGAFIGFRALRAPILHGIAIGLFSLVVWFALNVVVTVFGVLGWEALAPLLTATLLLVQMLAAVAGAWVGHRVALRGGAELREG